MASTITTLAELYVEIQRLMDGEDVDISDVSVESMERLVIVAQQRIYRDVKSRFNEKAFASVTVTSNLAALPSDFKELSIVHFGRQALVPVDETVMRDYWSSNGGTASKYVARAGNDLTFWPHVADGTAVQGRYFFAYPNLTNANIATNLLFQEADDLFIYGALVESAPFFGENAKMSIWQAKYLSIATDLNRQTHRAAYGKRLMMRPSASICGGGGGWSGGVSNESVDVDGLVDIQ